ncbi:hypothetical protein [Mycolicibacterium wolinskyi]|uniref:hypothetical protein n=1 Tax=Mycolicibacterium wolinskyi TaxID=59750 RepID=UPI00391782ED
MNDLQEIERRVTEKWCAAATARFPYSRDGFDVAQWFRDLPPLPPGTPQFPREQWVSYPAARTATLLVCERLLDSADKLTDEQWATLCLAMQYGGKTRVA